MSSVKALAENEENKGTQAPPTVRVLTSSCVSNRVSEPASMEASVLLSQGVQFCWVRMSLALSQAVNGGGKGSTGWVSNETQSIWG
ncbi:hypothetical protein GOODEAATRI_027091 [Goodea atripinnis]|uniref:Uncharacterized protein n=1 Tax=Goodea atripinnis TaxID=208336 RepID=A0ABV0PS25_9TELE